MIAVFSLAAYAPSWRSTVIPALVVAGFGVVQGSFDPDDPVGSAATLVIFEAIVLTVGGVVRRYRERTESMRRERDRAAAHALAVAAEERTRIARELHDMVAHGMSVVVLQARVDGPCSTRQSATLARRGRPSTRSSGWPQTPSTRCADSLASSGSSADGTPPLAPQPKLGQLEQLVAQAKASGEEVELVVEGQRRELAPAHRAGGVPHRAGGTHQRSQARTG